MDFQLQKVLLILAFVRHKLHNRIKNLLRNAVNGVFSNVYLNVLLGKLAYEESYTTFRRDTGRILKNLYVAAFHLTVQ